MTLSSKKVSLALLVGGLLLLVMIANEVIQIIERTPSEVYLDIHGQSQLGTKRINLFHLFMF
jgi:hypothetical protein